MTDRSASPVKRSTRVPAGLFLIVAMVGAACDSGTPAPSARPDTAPASASVPSPAPDVAAWQSELADLAPDGTRSIASALRMFAMAFGPIPGVDAASARPGVVGSASPAVRVVREERDQLTEEQRAAVDAWLDMGAEGDTIEVLPADPDLAGPTGDMAFASAVVARPVANAYGGQEDFIREVESEAARVRSRIALYWGDIPSLRIRFGNFGAVGLITFFNPTFGAGGFETCDVFVNTSTGNLDRFKTRRALTFDIVHCFQSWKMGSEAGFDGSVPAWAWEGPAEYLYLEMWPQQQEDSDAWVRYFERPDIPLFARNYDAVGYYAQLLVSGISVSAAMEAVLTDTSNEERFALAGSTSNRFLDSWAPGVARADWGGDWLLVGPGSPGVSVRAPRQPIAVEDGSLEAVSQEPYTNGVYLIESGADLLLVEFTGRARIHDGNIDIILRSPTVFCTSPEGCASECPDDTPLQMQPIQLQPVALLAISGGTDGTSGALSGVSLAEVCETPRPDDEFCERYRDLLHWWFRDPATDVGSKPWAAEIVRRFQEMRRFAPSAQQAAVDIHIGLYTAHATLSGPAMVIAAVPWAEQMPGAVANLDAYCDIGPADRAP